ncbi:hypothetical protein EROM_020980 [Encephalitozoon romaleae SJ-2008]|uniref:Uncharacterized protein n=1 Tax=Encephalitozoon romaleae (strain SJ-2008) TaxID=1178016 RepID=I6ZHA0_ENCRO|nr:hypothetical protein EROM_020980 [Encephalitozoon romaleae SJ-2008]AFN82573.1 hypothetical protein EROM_020980 [Encephalitozoon romaleae SJ-2008]
MDRIERFLGRRPTKKCRKVKSGGKEFLVTKKDVKLIRSYRKNVCMDPDVDLYRPLNLSFSRKTMDEGIETRRKTPAPQSRRWPKRKIRNGRRKVIEERNKNEIVDIWEEEGLEELNDYEQDMFVKAGEAYAGPVEHLEYRREDLEGDLRRIYLRLYEPREGKSYKLRDLIKDLPRAETLKPFPEEIGLSFRFEKLGAVGISQDFKKFGVGEENKLCVYEFKGFVKVKHVIFDSEIRKIMFTKGETICILLANNTICIVNDTFAEGFSDGQRSFLRKEFVMWSRKETEEGVKSSSCMCTVIKTDGKINDVEAHCDGRYISVVYGKKVMVYDLKEKKELEVLRVRGTVPLKARFHRSLDTMVISTASSLIVYDLVSRKIAREAKEFSFVLDFFSISDNIVVLVNNLKKIILYDWANNVVKRTMLQEDVGMEVIQHRRFNLMCVAYPMEMIVFYNDVGNDLVVPVKRIPGRYRNILFHPHLPWVYGANGNKVCVFT